MSKDETTIIKKNQTNIYGIVVMLVTGKNILTELQLLTRAQSVSHYNRPTLVSPPLASLRHLRDSIPTFANVRSPPGSRSTSRCLPISLPTLQTVPLVRLHRLTSLSSPAPHPDHSSTSPICSRQSPVFPEFSVLFCLLFPSSGLFPLSTISLSLPSATALFQCSPSRHYPIPFFRSLRSPLVPTCAPPILPPNTSRTSRVHCSAFRMLD